MVTHYQPLKYHGLINVPKVCVILGICLVFVVVWPEVDINISTYVQSTGASREQVSAALLGSPSRPEEQLVASPWRDRTTPGAFTGKYTYFCQKSYLGARIGSRESASSADWLPLAC